MEATYWSLKTELFHLERQTEQLKQALSQAKYDLRTAKAALLEYSGSFRAFLDKLSGKQEQRLFGLNRDQKRAESRLAETGRELGDASRKLEETRAILDTLPPAPDPKGEARYCIACLTVLLPEAEQALTESRTLMQNATPGKMYTRQEWQELYSEGDRRARLCADALKQLEAALHTLQIPFSLPNCYRDPVAYLANATDFIRRDRLNDLIGYSIQLQKQLSDLQRQL